MVETLRKVWRTHYNRDDGQLRWKEAKELPMTAERVQSPYDPEAHYSAKRGFEWVGYKVHVTEVCAGRSAPDHSRRDLSRHAAGHDEHGRRSRAPCGQEAAAS